MVLVVVLCMCVVVWLFLLLVVVVPMFANSLMARGVPCFPMRVNSGMMTLYMISC